MDDSAEGKARMTDDNFRIPRILRRWENANNAPSAILKHHRSVTKAVTVVRDEAAGVQEYAITCPRDQVLPAAGVFRSITPDRRDGDLFDDHPLPIRDRRIDNILSIVEPQTPRSWMLGAARAATRNSEDRCSSGFDTCKGDRLLRITTTRSTLICTQDAAASKPSEGT